MNENIKPLRHFCATIGSLPSSYLVSLSYEEQLIYLCRKMDEMIDILNNKFDEQIQIYLNNKFNDLMLNTMYDSESETLRFYLESEVI